MPNWSGTVLTAKGLALQAKVEAGTVMNITKLKIGDGVLGTGQTVAALSDLVHPIKIIDISALIPLANGTCKIHGIVTNAEIESGFYVRELGVFAQDPDVGEILYAYTADGSPDFLPPEGGPVAVSEELVINLAFSNAASITASIAMDGLVTVAVMQNAVSVHNADLNAHADLLHIWQSHKTYITGDVCRPRSLAYPSWIFLECIQGGTSDVFEPPWPAVGEEVTDGTVSWRVRDIKSGGGESIGSIKACLSNTPPPGWLALDTGAMVSRATYPQLWAWVQDNAPLVTEAEWQAQAAVQSSVGYYSTGDGSTTFRLPRLLDYQRGGLASEVGQWQGDAIRDITGTISNMLIRSVNADGAFEVTYGTSTAPSTASGGSTVEVRFKASNVVPVANENRPKTIRFLYCVKAFDAVTDPGLLNSTEVVNELANKIDKSDQGYGTQLWISDEYTPVLNTPTVVSHNLNIDPLKCKSDVKLKCVSAEAGYAVGDYAISPVGVAQTNATEYWLCPALNATTIQQNTAAGNLYALNKANGNYIVLTPAKWRYIFRIWY